MTESTASPTPPTAPTAFTTDRAVAVIGMSCRFAPDLTSPEAFWAFLAAGRSTVGPMPEKRWRPYAATPKAASILRGTTLLGAYLDDIEGFDADFFGISPREAAFLDPQQRFVLELAWEALADAGVAPLSLRGTDAGVYVAANSNDYGRRLLEDIPRTGAYAVNGTTYYGLANRVSYFLDLRGPSIAVDTACAGSLTALHLAAQSLRDGETPLAIVGGVNLISTPVLNVALQESGALAPDGRSKAFDKDADGYGRGEGAGVVVLKRLADALRDGDPVQALILGSGVFQDGRSEGMMAPNAEAQAYMLRRIYTRLGISPASVDYVEAHGTGTPTGDTMEIEALAKVFGAVRTSADPCLIGSVKPNIGHIEGGSGLAGVIKTVLALRHEQLPPSLYNEPHPSVRHRTSGLRIVADTTPWPIGRRRYPRRAGVSSYGVGGTITHLVLEESPPQPPQPKLQLQPLTTHPTAPTIYPLSAMSESGVRALAGSVADWLTDHPATSLASVGHTLALRRSHLPQRAAVVAASAEQLVERFRGIAEGRTASGTAFSRTVFAARGGVVWVFSGHGAQWSGMGRALLAEDPAFAAAIDGLAGTFRAELGWAPREALEAGGPWTSAHIQGLTFAVQIGLTASWRARGLRPSAVIGHSVGEIAAAVAAGALDLQEAARFACRRAAALQRLEGMGAMAMAGIPFDEAAVRLADRTDVEAAISASPHSSVVTGQAAAVRALVAEWRAHGIEMHEVDAAIAFHSRQVDAVLSEVRLAAAELTPRQPVVALYSTALVQPRSRTTRDSRYWAMNLRRPVRFAEAAQAALEDGHRLFLEVSAHPVVSHSISETAHHLGVEDVTVVGTLRRHTAELETLLTNLATLHCHGAELDWSAIHPEGDLLPIPATAWQHRPYWVFPAHDTPDLPAHGRNHDPSRHSLLGGVMTVSGSPSRQVWQTHLDIDSRPYPLRHGLVGVEVTPAASILNTFAEATAAIDHISLTDIALRTPLAVEPPRIVQIVREGRSLSLATRLADEPSAADEWLTHATATIDTPTGATRRPPPFPDPLDPDSFRTRLPQGDPDAVWRMFEAMGVGAYAFPWNFVELRRDEDEQFAILDLEPPPAATASSWAHVIDGALTISAAVAAPGGATTLWMSKSIEQVAFRGEPPARVMVRSKRSATSSHDTVDVWVADMTGEVRCVCLGLRFAAVEQPDAAALPRELVYEVAWRPLELTDPQHQQPTGPQQVVFVGASAASAPLVNHFETAGVPCFQAVAEPELQDDIVDLDPAWFTRPGTIVVAPALQRPGETPETAAQRSAWTLVRTVQRLIELKKTLPGVIAQQRVWALTRGVRAARDERSLAHGSLWGTARIIAGEHPELWGGAIDLPHARTLTDTTAAQLLAMLQTASGREDVISLTPHGPQAARLAPIDRPADTAPLRCSPSGTVLITGGLGALGLEIARWLVDRGARRLVLTGRRGLPPRADWDAVTDPDTRRKIDGVLALEALGVTVAAVPLDVTDAAQAAQVLAPGALGLPPIRGVVHAAGVVDDDLVDKVDLCGLRAVLAPKADGAMVLHRRFPPGTLDFFLLFSSCGQFARLSGQTSYAAANSFLDTLAAHRNAAGHTETRSIGWTAWQGRGMSADIAATMLEANARGLDAVTTAEALAAWSFADRFRADYQAVLRVLPTPPHARLPMLRDLTPPTFTSTTAPVPAPTTPPTISTLDFTTLPDAEARTRITADVREQVAAELNLDPAEVALKRPLVELGVDSVMTVALRIRLQRRYGIDLPPTILWAKPNVATLSEHVADHLRHQAHPET